MYNGRRKSIVMKCAIREKMKTFKETYKNIDANNDK